MVEGEKKGGRKEGRKKTLLSIWVNCACCLLKLRPRNGSFGGREEEGKRGGRERKGESIVA